MNVMFVCTANTCRSAMAEVIFKSMVDDDVSVCSAGVYASSGHRASKNTVDVCRSHGLDASGHKATCLEDSRIEEMDLVLTATWDHKKSLEKLFPHLDNVFTIKEFAGLYPLDINDPFGYDLACYAACFREIYDALEKICSDDLLKNY